MNSRTHADLMFETIASCALLAAVAAFAALVFKLITLGTTFFESMARAELLFR
jgi:hypothetical protein